MPKRKTLNIVAKVVFGYAIAFFCFVYLFRYAMRQYLQGVDLVNHSKGPILVIFESRKVKALEKEILAGQTMKVGAMIGKNGKGIIHVYPKKGEPVNIDVQGDEDPDQPIHMTYP